MFLSRWNYIVFTFLLFIQEITCQSQGFSINFRDFLIETYGKRTLEILERKDLAWGSFGGKTFPSQRVHKQPVLMIHGVATVAGRFLMLRKYLYNKGYTDAELYATTWGKGPKGGLIFVKMECSFVRQIRTMIEAIKMYTNASKIDIVAFSMGVPLTRKAILGGDCNGFDLGKPLTNWVDTFVSVAGANFGSSMCVYLPWAICNLNNGLNCHSHTLRELNNRRNRYEGAHSFAIITNNDAKVGDWCCGNKCASLPHSLQEFNYDGPTHDEVLYKSIELQYELISRHRGNLSYTNVDKIPNPSPPLSPKEVMKLEMKGKLMKKLEESIEVDFNLENEAEENQEVVEKKKRKHRKKRRKARRLKNEKKKKNKNAKKTRRKKKHRKSKTVKNLVSKELGDRFNKKTRIEVTTVGSLSSTMRNLTANEVSRATSSESISTTPTTILSTIFTTTLNPSQTLDDIKKNKLETSSTQVTRTSSTNMNVILTSQPVTPTTTLHSLESSNPQNLTKSYILKDNLSVNNATIATTSHFKTEETGSQQEPSVWLVDVLKQRAKTALDQAEKSLDQELMAQSARDQNVKQETSKEIIRNLWPLWTD